MTAISLLVLALAAAGEPATAAPAPAPMASATMSDAELEGLWAEACLWEVGSNRERVPAARHRLAESGTRAVEFLVPARLDTRDTLVTRALEAVLREIGAEAIPPLVRALSAAAPSVRRNAADLLGALGAREAAPGIAGLLADPEARLGALSALGKLGARDSAPAVAELMQDATVPERVRTAAAVTLGELGGDRAVAALVRALSERSVPVRFAAQFALEKLGAVAELRLALSDPDARVRLHAIVALGHVGDAAARPELLALLEHPDRRFRAFAVEALAGMMDRATKRRLERRFGAEIDPLVRGKLAAALGR